jgi:hypothetical protein
MINPENICHLVGVVQAFPRYGDNWTRYNRFQRGQVRFWLGVSRELAGDGFDLLLCAIEPKDLAEIRHYETELRSGRTVHLEASAHVIKPIEMPDEDAPGVIFVAECCGFDGGKALPVHHKHRVHAHGKMAAAADDSGQLLPLEGNP